MARLKRVNRVGLLFFLSIYLILFLTLFHTPHGHFDATCYDAGHLTPVAPGTPPARKRSPLCKLNPLYEQVVALRFKALTYLVDECGEDLSLYC
ncbi:hypothetical protein IQ272_14835 [Chroococcidiopsidales cyanobacterium LEGE 13417]|nr:hypothetical protein [Chroococcidiopsidales cyanobacterium LEGE 13417]